MGGYHHASGLFARASAGIGPGDIYDAFALSLLAGQPLSAEDRRTADFEAQWLRDAFVAEFLPMLRRQVGKYLGRPDRYDPDQRDWLMTAPDADADELARMFGTATFRSERHRRENPDDVHNDRWAEIAGAVGRLSRESGLDGVVLALAGVGGLLNMVHNTGTSVLDKLPGWRALWKALEVCASGTPGQVYAGASPDVRRLLRRGLPRAELLGAIASVTRAWWRGTDSAGPLAPNASGVIWLTSDKDVAKAYGARLLAVELDPSARLVDLRDIGVPVVREIKDMASAKREATVGHPISDAEWPRWADFGLLEANPWILERLRQDGAAGAVVADSAGSSARPHESLALLDPEAVRSVSEVGDGQQRLAAAPTLDCTKCGACCACGWCVELTDGETGRFLADPELRGMVRLNQGIGRWESGEDDEPGFMKEVAKGGRIRCAALRGDVGRRALCSIYERRPRVCRDFKPGSGRCLEARAAHGIGRPRRVAYHTASGMLLGEVELRLECRCADDFGAGYKDESALTDEDREHIANYEETREAQLAMAEEAATLGLEASVSDSDDRVSRHSDAYVYFPASRMSEVAAMLGAVGLDGDILDVPASFPEAEEERARRKYGWSVEREYVSPTERGA